MISPSSHPIFDLGLPLEEALDDKVLQSLLPLEERVWHPLLPLEDKVLHSLPPSFFFKHGAWIMATAFIRPGFSTSSLETGVLCRRASSMSPLELEHEDVLELLELLELELDAPKGRIIYWM